MEEMVFRPIGIVHSPFKTAEGAPIQPTGARGVRGQIEILEEFSAGLRDLDGFSHIILIYRFHLSRGYALEVKPFLDDQTHGLFATRSPRRPNAIGISTVRLVAIEGNVLQIEDVDVLDGTPVLDIKPFVPEFDSRDAERIGWMAGKAEAASTVKGDGRFAKESSGE